MKNKVLLILPLLISTLSSCNDNEEYFKTISYKEYVELINNQQENERCIVVVTSPTCSHCKEMEPYIIKYQKEFNEIPVYKLVVELKDNMFTDTTMGIYKDANDDMLKKLDYRIAKYVNATQIKDLLFNPSGTYMYLYTPTTIWYDSKMEVKIKNSFNEDNYEDFKTFFEFEDKKENWKLPFDLTYYTSNVEED